MIRAASFSAPPLLLLTERRPCFGAGGSSRAAAVAVTHHDHAFASGLALANDEEPASGEYEVSAQRDDLQLAQAGPRRQ